MIIKGRLIVCEGDVSTAFYFILSGQCQVFKIRDEIKNIVGYGLM